MLSIRLKVETDRRLDALAKLTGRTKSYYVRELIEQNLEDLEDRFIAESRLEKNQKPIPAKEVRKRLGLDN